MSTSFPLSSYDIRNRCKRLDGGPVDEMNRRSRLVRYTHGGHGTEPRIIRIEPDERGSAWKGINDGLGKFYLAGPMRGYQHFNFPAFLMAARVLEARGFEIVSPAEKDLEAGFDPSRPIEGQKFDVGAAFRWDFEAVVKSRGIILMPGWDRSTGAKAERLVAFLGELEVYLLDADFNLVEAPEADYTLTWTPKAQPVQAQPLERGAIVDRVSGAD